jgi:hypothetical protein
MGHSSPSGDGMTERGYDALLSSAEGIASDYRREPVKAVPLDPDAPAAAPQHGEKSPALIVKRLGVAYRPTLGIKSGAMRRRFRARDRACEHRRQLGCERLIGRHRRPEGER